MKKIYKFEVNNYKNLIYDFFFISIMDTNIIYDILRKVPLVNRKRTAATLFCSSRKFKNAKLIIDEIDNTPKITPIDIKITDCLFYKNELILNDNESISMKMLEYPKWVFKEFTTELDIEIKDIPHYWETNTCITCAIKSFDDSIKLSLKYNFDRIDYLKLPIWYTQYKLNRVGLYNLKIINNILTRNEDITITYEIYQHDERPEYFSLHIILEIFQNSSSCNVILLCDRTFSFVFKNNKIIWDRKVNNILNVPPLLEDLSEIKTKSGWTTLTYNDGTICKLLDYNNINYVLRIPCDEIEKLIIY